MTPRMRAVLGGIFLTAGLAAAPVQGRWHYPGGYGRWGWGGWGADPGAGYMAGLGAFARGQGAYELKDAQARAINEQTVEKWNKALRDRQRALRKERAEDQARINAQAEADARRTAVESGDTLNYLVDRVYDADPLGKKVAALKIPVSADEIRAIPFESETEAISISLNQLTGRDDWPTALSGDRLAPQRTALRQAVEAALAEDVRGEVSEATTRKAIAAADALRARFAETTSELSPDYTAADTFLKSVTGLAYLLHNPQARKAIEALESYKGGTAADLLTFMHAFNLRFGRATTERQRALYRRLDDELGRAVGQLVSAEARIAADRSADATGEPLRAAAGQVFGGLDTTNRPRDGR